MSMNSELMSVVQSTRYPLDAFLFIQRGLDFTVRRMHGDTDPLEESFEEDAEQSSRHVSGQDLCRGLRDFAIHEYGLLARTVLGRWHITSCRDFGEIVFAMVEGGLMHKTDDDTIRDFLNVFDFTTAFSPGLMLSEGV
ncbi:hypothetical protein OT109_15700 [Phycisphaeraceae bacterium D3-23]